MWYVPYDGGLAGGKERTGSSPNKPAIDGGRLVNK